MSCVTTINVNIVSYTIQYDTIRYNTIQFDTSQRSLIQYMMNMVARVFPQRYPSTCAYLPGATMSGLIRPSAVGPLDEK